MNKLPMKLTNAKQRNQHGVGVVVLVLILAFFVIGVIGLFSFEVTRNNSARDELRSSCEAASLAAAAALASANTLSAVTNHSQAETAAQQAFVANTILGTLLSDVNYYDSQSGTTAGAIAKSQPASNAANFFIEFLDSTGAQTAWGSPSGRVVHIVAVFGEQPAFGQYVGIPTVDVVCESKAQVPQMDIMMCFDVSSSIDDQSKVTWVKRWWNGSKIQYDIATTSTGSKGEGSIYSVLLPTPLGASVNIEYPQTLDYSSVYTNKLNFNGSLRAGPTGGETGQPPGNFSGGSAGGTTDFTDLVSNLDGNNHFAGFTYVDPISGLTYAFPSLGALVEASRGNLENPGVFTSSQAALSLPGVTPQAGYQSTYLKLTHAAAEPIGSARVSAQSFFNLMGNNTDAQFGFISFSSVMPSLNPTGTHGTTKKIAGSYAAGGNVTPPYQGQPLAANVGPSIANNIIPQTVADGSTDIGDALQMAVNQLVSNGRPGSNKAIVFFTDGQSNAGPSWNAAAAQAKTNAIAIYTIGMAQNAAIIPGECDTLNDQGGKTITYTDPITGSAGSYTPGANGMAGVAGHGSKFFLVTKYSDLPYVFENIARQLVQLTLQ